MALVKDLNGGPGKLKGFLPMMIVSIFKENTGFDNPVYAVPFEACKRRLKLYFSDLEKVKQKIIAGEIINSPYVTFQRDRRIKEEKRIENERRKQT